MNIFETLRNSLKKKSETQENGVGKLLTSAAPTLIRNKISSTFSKKAEEVEKFSNVTAPETFFKVLNIPSAALLGALQEAKKGGMPQVGAVKGVVEGFKNKEFYAGKKVEEFLGKKGASPTTSALAGLGTELLIPGIAGEAKYAQKLSNIQDASKIVPKAQETVETIAKTGVGEKLKSFLNIGKSSKIDDITKAIEKGEVAESAIHLTDKGKDMYALLTPKQLAGLRDEVANIPNSLGDSVHLTSLNAILNSKTPLKQVSLDKIMKSSKNAKTALEGVQEPIQKLLNAVERAAPARAAREAAYTAERTRRIGEAAEVGKKISGEQGYLAQLSKLTGELPKPKFEPIRTDLTQPDIDSLFNTIRESKVVGDFQKITAQTGLKTILEGGLPVESQLKLLKEVYGPEIVKTLLDKRGFFPKMLDATGEVLNVPRAIMSSYDVSAPFRQGVMMVTRPKQFFGAFKSMFKQLVSEDAYKVAQEEIASRPTFDLMQQAKLDLTEVGGSLSTKEEAFMSNLAEKIPGLGIGVRASSRAYTGFLNKLRADVFDDIVSQAQKSKINLDEKTLSSLGEFINTFTGRGKLPGAIQSAAPVLNGVFFSPRLMASRLQILNPQFYAKLPPVVRKQALYSLFSTLGLGATMLGVAKTGGADVEVNPRSADFGKIKLGNTRIDVWGGLQQYARLAGQLYTGELISTTSGKLSKVGEGFQPVTRMEIISRFLQSKEAPVASFVTNLFKGEDSLGNPIDLPKEVIDRITPMVIGDMYDLYKEYGPEGLPLIIPSMLGMGVSTYGKNEPKTEVNAAGQPVVKMKPVSDLGEDILKFLKPQKEIPTEGAVPQGSANSWYRFLKGLPPEEANKKLDYISEKNPNLASLIKKEIKYDKIGTTPKDESLLKLGVGDGKRAAAIAKIINKLETPEEKNTYYKRLKEASIISSDVEEQLKLMRSKGEI